MLFAASLGWACVTAFATTAPPVATGPAWRRDPQAILAIARAQRRADDLSAAVGRVLAEHGVGRGDVRYESVVPAAEGRPSFPRTEMAVDVTLALAPVLDALEASVKKLEGATVRRESRVEHERLSFRLDGTEVVAVELYPMRLPAGGGGPRIAIVIDDVGYAREPIERLLGASTDITFAVLPYGPHARDLAIWIHAEGAEVMLHLPMQPEGEPGGFSKDGMLLESMDAAELKKLVNDGLEKVPHAAGVNNHMGSVLTARAEPMRIVMEALASRGRSGSATGGGTPTKRGSSHLFFLDSRTTSKTVAYRLAREAGVPAAERDVFLDDVASVKAIEAQLDRLEGLANKHGSAIAIGHPYPETVEALLAWLPTLEEKGFELVPASRLAGLATPAKPRP